MPHLRFASILPAGTPVLLLSLAAFSVSAAEDWDWAAPMKLVHAKGLARKGSVSQIGDSITYSKAFLAGMAWGDPKGDEWKSLRERVEGKLLNERKGPEHGNFSGWTAADGLGKIKAVLAAEKPEVAVVMYGTNDVNKNVALDAYSKQLGQIVDACIEAGCIPILSTIPPILNKDEKVKAFNDAIKKLAAEKKIPLVDFHTEILARQPGTAWNGTLLGKNDVHPSGGENMNFSEENLKKCGYALRNFITCRAMREVIEKCFK